MAPGGGLGIFEAWEYVVVPRGRPTNMWWCPGGGLQIYGGPKGEACENVVAPGGGFTGLHKWGRAHQTFVNTQIT